MGYLPIRALLLALVAGPVHADQMAVFVRNQHHEAVALELHSRQTVWPGGDQVYLIEPNMKKSIPIDCAAGERICYAAWVSGRASISWGVEAPHACEDCCATCVAKSTMTIDIEAR